MSGHEHVLSVSFSRAGSCWRCAVCDFSIIINTFPFCEPGMSFFSDGTIFARPANLESDMDCFRRIYPRMVKTACPASDEAKLAAWILLT